MNFNDLKPKHFEKVLNKGLLNEKDNFLAMNAFEWDDFLKFVLEIDKELKKSNNIRLIVLSSAIAIERFMDMLFIKIYNLDRYKKFDASYFLSNISFQRKIKLINELKRKYKKKKPKKSKTKEYKSHIHFSLEFLREAKKKFGKKILLDLEEIEKDINRKRGIEKPNWANVYVNNPKPVNVDYLPDDVIDVLRKIDIKELNRIKDFRNTVAHKWDYQKVLEKELKVKRQQLSITLKELCLETINHLAGLSLK